VLDGGPVARLTQILLHAPSRQRTGEDLSGCAKQQHFLFAPFPCLFVVLEANMAPPLLFDVDGKELEGKHAPVEERFTQARSVSKEYASRSADRTACGQCLLMLEWRVCPREQTRGPRVEDQLDALGTGLCNDSGAESEFFIVDVLEYARARGIRHCAKILQRADHYVAPARFVVGGKLKRLRVFVERLRIVQPAQQVGHINNR
jgi:hypothetical protein